MMGPPHIHPRSHMASHVAVTYANELLSSPYQEYDVITLHNNTVSSSINLNADTMYHVYEQTCS